MLKVNHQCRNGVAILGQVSRKAAPFDPHTPGCGLVLCWLASIHLSGINRDWMIKDCGSQREKARYFNFDMRNSLHFHNLFQYFGRAAYFEN